jgi:hypothetical protein
MHRALAERYRTRASHHQQELPASAHFSRRVLRAVVCRKHDESEQGSVPRSSFLLARYPAYTATHNVAHRFEASILVDRPRQPRSLSDRSASAPHQTLNPAPNSHQPRKFPHDDESRLGNWGAHCTDRFLRRTLDQANSRTLPESEPGPRNTLDLISHVSAASFHVSSSSRYQPPPGKVVEYQYLSAFRLPELRDAETERRFYWSRPPRRLS